MVMFVEYGKAIVSAKRLDGADSNNRVQNDSLSISMSCIRYLGSTCQVVDPI